VRPWQHVLEPLSGYLALGAKLLNGETAFAEGWNFGPSHEGLISVEETAKALGAQWDAVKFRLNPPPEQPHEAGLLALDCTKAETLLHWHGVLTPEETFALTARWYRAFYTEKKVLTLPQLEQYIHLAEERKLEWTK